MDKQINNCTFDRNISRIWLSFQWWKAIWISELEENKVRLWYKTPSCEEL